ncbi:MAG: response regulator transcription factor [Spirochaetes bacterium]|nr:response regulator transcription factor [Spirochaetota bacterium]
MGILSHWIFFVNVAAFSTGIASLLALAVIRFRSPGRIFRSYFALFCSLLMISVLSMVDLYFEANLPAARPGLRRGYFFLMAVNVGLFSLALAYLYGAVFSRPRMAHSGWLFVAAAIPVVAADVFYFPEAALPPVSLAFLKAAALLIGAAICLVFVTPRLHANNIEDVALRRYVSLAFAFFAMLLILYLVKQATGDRNEFFAVYGRVHFGVFFAAANLTTLYYAVKFLARPAPTAAVTAPGEIRLSKEFSGSFRLTPREAVIVAEIIAGKSNREIARAVDVTEGTVKIFVHNIYKKTGVNNRMALAALVRRQQQVH